MIIRVLNPEEVTSVAAETITGLSRKLLTADSVDGVAKIELSEDELGLTIGALLWRTIAQSDRIIKLEDEVSSLKD